jgi:hypothetical protein
MKIAIAVALLLTMTAGAQQQSQPQRRAPLTNVEDLEPAVDVSAPRVALATPPAAPTVTPAATPVPPPPPAPVSAPAQGMPAERPAPRVMDSLDLGTTSITGNAELPKVLYIVPWKKSDLGDLVGRPVNTLLDEVLAPVDPAVFERHLSYYDSLYGERAEE